MFLAVFVYCDNNQPQFAVCDVQSTFDPRLSIVTQIDDIRQAAFYPQSVEFMAKFFGGHNQIVVLLHH